MKRRWISVILILALLFSVVGQSLFAGGKAEVAGEKQLVIGAALPMLTHSFWIPLLYGIQDEAAKLGVKVVYLEAGGFTHLDKQINQIENLMQQGVDALLVGATDAKGVVPVVEQAMAMGIPVVGVGSQAATENVTTKILADDYEMGVIQADALAELYGSKGEFVMFSGPPGNEWSEDRAAGFRETVEKKYPNMKIVAEQWTEVDRTIASNLMETWMQAFPNLNGVYSANDDLAAAAVASIVAAGKQNQIKVASANPTEIGLQNLDNGLVAAFAIQQTVLQGREGVRAAYKAMTGQPTDKTVLTPALKLTRENHATFDFSSVRHPETFKP
ncbi:MAG: sugar ABC transporter substrate-binding protein [Sphaerochaetaceae bacterium]